MTGRNALCPCGSGKKYKKCCLVKQNTFTQLARGTPENKLTEALENNDYNYTLNTEHQEAKKHFENASKELDDYLNLNAEAVDQEGVFNHFDAFYLTACKANCIDQFITKVNVLKERHQDIYEKESKYILDLVFDVLLRTDRIDEAHKVFSEFCKKHPTSIDKFYDLIYKLTCYGQYYTIEKGVYLIWPALSESETIMGWGKEKLKLEQCWRTCFNEYNLGANKEKLTEKLLAFHFSDKEINDYIYLYDEFNLDPNILLNEIQLTDLQKEDKQNLCLRNIFKLLALSLANENSLNPCAAISYWDSISSYFSDRNTGQLELKVEDIDNLIEIEELTLDRYMKGRFCGMFGLDFTPYRAVMFLQAMIYWVIFADKYKLSNDPIHDLYQLIPLAIATYKLSEPSVASLFIYTEARKILITLVKLLDDLKEGSKIKLAEVLHGWAIPNMQIDKAS